MLKMSEYAGFISKNFIFDLKKGTCVKVSWTGDVYKIVDAWITNKETISLEDFPFRKTTKQKIIVAQLLEQEEN